MVASQVDITRALAIGGYMSERELTWLATMVKKYPECVEFGCFHGRSTRALADNSPGRIWAVDVWNGVYKGEDGNEVPINTYVLPYFKQNLRDHIDSGRVVVARGYSFDFCLPFPIDMVFIDGDHRYETVVKDIKKAYDLLRYDGLICGHDFNHSGWPGVKKAVEEYVPHFQLEETIWWALKH